MSVKLEAGQWYRTRGGSIVYCVGKKLAQRDLIYPFVVCESDGVDTDYKENGSVSTREDHRDDIIEHLPDCTGFDWEPTPKLQLREGAWYERKDGKIVGPCEVDPEQPNDHGYKWTATPWRYRDDGSNLVTEDQWLVREVEPPQPKYRPFKDGVEFQPERERWLRSKRDGYLTRVVAFNDKHIWIGGATIGTTYDQAMEQFVFMDGSPFGVLDDQ